ncbi:MAG: ATP-binding protein [Candidatus Colwellbacteria bacterium]|jgi:MinD superfamily P-loop ATPase|nr:ATP-binding protein [Candidatus Colwellbacteria bacterium]MCK9497791.1 ATP-binding protein [Candidatus Colwellbacteria bacterium]MDD3752759.1 ATP-binding protein [Candidatus Colwellbacteria bacterium]MDD4818970.1 ATP-binding protein [Candidatus Colwellbacteria bacterium]
MRIAVTGGKGGVGKSLIASSLAVEFAKQQKTALLDVDVECPNDHLLLSVERKEYSKIYQPIPKWDFNKCMKCGKCAEVCKQNAIVFVKGKYPAFSKDVCIGCKACMIACPYGAISETKKEIGTIYTGSNYGVDLVSGELKLGELASGEVVAKVREKFKEINKDLKADIILIDSAAGIGCPVIASLVGTDYIAAVTEPTPSALHDLKRVLYLAEHFGIAHGIIINKFDIAESFCSEIEDFAREKNIEIIGRLPYEKSFIESTIKMKPVVEAFPGYQKKFQEIIKKIITSKK